MTAYNPPLYSGIPSFKRLFFTSTNTDNLLTYPVSKQTNETFLGSVFIDQKLTVGGVLTATAAGSLVQNANSVLANITSSVSPYHFPMCANLGSSQKPFYI